VKSQEHGSSLRIKGAEPRDRVSRSSRGNSKSDVAEKPVPKWRNRRPSTGASSQELPERPQTPKNAADPQKSLSESLFAAIRVAAGRWGHSWANDATEDGK